MNEQKNKQKQIKTLFSHLFEIDKIIFISKWSYEKIYEKLKYENFKIKIVKNKNIDNEGKEKENLKMKRTSGFTFSTYAHTIPFISRH